MEVGMVIVVKVLVFVGKEVVVDRLMVFLYDCNVVIIFVLFIEFVSWLIVVFCVRVRLVMFLRKLRLWEVFVVIIKEWIDLLFILGFLGSVMVGGFVFVFEIGDWFVLLGFFMLGNVVDC